MIWGASEKTFAENHHVSFPLRRLSRLRSFGIGSGYFCVPTATVYLQPAMLRTLANAFTCSALLHSPEIRTRGAEFAPQVDSPAAVNRACDLLEGLGRSARTPGTQSISHHPNSEPS
jgi:hypothetical protein